MSVRRLLAAAAVLLTLAGCSNSVTNPVPTIPLSSLLLIPAVDTLHVGDTHGFTVAAEDTGGVPVANPVLAWSSSNPGVFTVNSAGTVTAVGEGTATLRASSGGLTAAAALLVLPTQRGWFKQVSTVSANLNSVFFLANGNSGWAVGAGGEIVHTGNAGAAWLPQTSGVATALNSVWFTSATEGWAVGDGGKIVHTTNAGASWSVVASGRIDQLLGVEFATRDTGWAVGENGTILRTFNRGATWTRSSVTARTLRAVSFAGTRDGWAVGDNGVICGTHDRGLTWFLVQPALTSQTLYALQRTSVQTATAVGNGGVTPRTIVTPDSTAWELRSTGAANELHGVHFVDALRGWAVGRNGTGLAMVTTDGGVIWTPQDVNNAFQLNAVQFVDNLRGWAVGDNGSILHTVTGGETP